MLSLLVENRLISTPGARKVSDFVGDFNYLGYVSAPSWWKTRYLQKDSSWGGHSAVVSQTPPQQQRGKCDTLTVALVFCDASAIDRSIKSEEQQSLPLHIRTVRVARLLFCFYFLQLLLHGNMRIRTKYGLDVQGNKNGFWIHRGFWILHMSSRKYCPGLIVFLDPVIPGDAVGNTRTSGGWKSICLQKHTNVR